MAKQIVAWCDPHMANEEQVPGRSFQVSINGAKPIEIDLCEQHEKEYLNPLRELLGDAGQPVAATTTAAAPSATLTKSGAAKMPCNQRGCTSSLTREGMRKHLMNIHGMDRAAAGDIVREAFGSVRTPTVGRYVCPECKVEFDTPQGRGAHRRATHGIEGTTGKK